MTSYHTVPVDEQQLPTTPTFQPRKSRSALATVMLTICIITFVLQTELAQYVQKTTNYSKPYFILYISHSCYVFMLPLQFLAEYINFHHYKSRSSTNNNNSIYRNIIDTINNSKSSVTNSIVELQYRVQGNHVFPLGFILKTSLCLSILLTLPSYIWYLSVNLTTMSNLTAIYNTGCFFAYLFSIIMLHDRIVAAKVGAVLLCMLGVLSMACWPQGTDDSGDNVINDSHNGTWVGIAVSSFGAALYGFYEVYYKKYASPSQPTILFANTITGAIGIVTFFVLWIPFPILHFSGVETFELPDLTTFKYILAIASMSVIYNATFMAVIALVNPVFAAVGVMLTVPAVAITDILVTGVMVPPSTIVGSLLILIGFIILNRHVGNEEKIDQSLALEGQDYQQ